MKKKSKNEMKNKEPDSRIIPMILSFYLRVSHKV